ncbi:MAG: hypothetical protein A3J58_02515 [Candidatus Sungbacteria bacterium RIFCSPHIGHO2_02_FULL_52_23]|uniref:Uncharacterized protein n=1 Tax=Candidatus Sungbacteria bacterium RIFCSPHIGHO2_02_FULL_52_23 TaxID=1802274 RepID=A0A1G2KXE7_9BACT|nr:MAG: hypothetical protein A3J58_02515 [Candidatus Sungbacteria bacterium RIFCSPHIGHO2_02_FULL_52_23]
MELQAAVSKRGSITTSRRRREAEARGDLIGAPNFYQTLVIATTANHAAIPIDRTNYVFSAFPALYLTQGTTNLQ